MIKERNYLRKIEKEGFFKDIIIKDYFEGRRKITVRKQKRMIASWMYKLSNYNININFKDIWPKEVKFPIQILSITGYNKINIDIKDSNSQSYMLKASNTTEYGPNLFYEIIKTNLGQKIEEETIHYMQFIPKNRTVVIKEKRTKKNSHEAKEFCFEKNDTDVFVTFCRRNQKVEINYSAEEEELNKEIEEILWKGDGWKIYKVISILKRLLPIMNKNLEKINLKIETNAYGICGEKIVIESGIVKNVNSLKIVSEKEIDHNKKTCYIRLEDFLKEY